jgi:hypothetical protein
LTPTVKLTNNHDTTGFVRCCLCDTRNYIARDSTAFIAHMVNIHGASASSFEDVPWCLSFPHMQVGNEGPAENNPSKVRYADKCYGCGAEFLTTAALVSHMHDVHIDIGGA